MDVAEHLTFGLRFNRASARTLRNLAEQAKGHGQGDVGLYFKAAESTEIGEPLVVKCESRDEVELMAALFTRLGVKRPAIEDLNG